MSGHLSLDLFGILNGSADGPLAIGALVLIALLASKRLWWR